MILRNTLVFSSILLISFSAFAQWQKRDVRIDPIFFPLQYWGIHSKVKREMRKTGEENVARYLETCPIQSVAHNEELCLHNRFLFLDFILYYDLVKRYCPKGMKQADFALQLARTRDSLYGKWIESLTNYQNDGYFEWEDATLDRIALEEYLTWGSQRFRMLQSVSSVFNRKPSKRNAAKRLVYEKLNAHTPFSSIQPQLGFALAADSNINKNLSVILNALRQDTFPEVNTFHLLSKTLGSDRKALELLGSLSAQRMYMVRDYRSWLTQQDDLAMETQQLQAFQLSSELYFTLESAGREFGSQVLFPESVKADSTSFKAYHFWTTALLAYQLAEDGFDEKTVIKEATRPARKYKRFIQIPGILHNLILLRPIRSGTTADFHKVLKEQRLGAQWGYRFFQLKDGLSK